MDPGGRDRDDDIISLATETLCPTTSPFAQAPIYSFLAPLLFLHFLSFLYHNPSTHLREYSSPSLDASLTQRPSAVSTLTQLLPYASLTPFTKISMDF